MPDYRKSLEELEREWSDCAKCELGMRRRESGGAFVFGQGTVGGVMFVGEGPGREEEKSGYPFVGPSGRILRTAIEKLNLDRVYITNAVSCRSCAQAYNSEGQPIYGTNRRTGQKFPIIKDEQPTPTQLEACRPRLQEEIYLVDPILIVALGGQAANALIGKSISVTKERGNTFEIEIPGAGYHPVVTPTTKKWYRKHKGQTVLPVAQNSVKYLVLPTLHPSFVSRKRMDKRHDNPTTQFIRDMKYAAQIYGRYRLEVAGEIRVEPDLSPDDLFVGEEDG